ncbi:MAG: hypothetical protein ABIE14_00550 [Patescibacteria group bacterium]
MKNKLDRLKNRSKFRGKFNSSDGMLEKDFLVTVTGAELPGFSRPTYLLALPDEKLSEHPAIKFALAKLPSLVHAGGPRIEFGEINPAKLKSEKIEMTCMDAREFSKKSRDKLRGENFVTFAGSAFFAHPEIAEKLRTNDYANFADAVEATLAAAQEKNLKIGILSNHFGEDGGCGGLNFVRENCGGLEIPTAEDYRKLFEETRKEINSRFGGIVENAELVMYQTGTDGTIVASFNLEDEKEFAAFAENYDGNF